MFTEAEENYALALAANGMDAVALPVMDTLIAQGRASKRIRKGLDAVYSRAKGDSSGYGHHLALLQKALRRHIAETLQGKMIQQPAPAFSLPDLDGHLCSLQQWKGKTVVADFWGMGCVPCKRSFPAMQAAIDRYKGDSNIVFVFINEAVSNPLTAAQLQQIRDYLAANHFSFHVLIDARTSTGWGWGAGTDYQVNALPTKFVIDKDGRIRFKIFGFGGDNDALLEELSVMIQMAEKSYF